MINPPSRGCIFPCLHFVFSPHAVVAPGYPNYKGGAMKIAHDKIGTLNHQLQSILQDLSQQQEVGLAPNVDDQDQAEKLDKMLNALQNVLDFLKEQRQGIESEPLPPDSEPPIPESANILLDGLYEGGNQELFIELRVDETGSGVISADMYRTGPTGRSYVASIRTTPGKAIVRNKGAWPILGSDNQDQNTTGLLTLTPQATDGSSLTGILFLESALTGLPVRTNIHFAANFSAPHMRRMGIELELEENVNSLPPFDFEGQEVTVSSALETAGFDIRNVGATSHIPTPAQGWGTAQLHTLMVDLAQANLSGRAWELHLLLLSESSRDGLFGIMFDSTDPLPRQGAAVFSEEIRSRVTPDHFPRKLIQTTVHELGHALNLAHRFERVVGRANSTSFMNYDWRYLGGNNQTKFWSDFHFTFDPDELEFLRHAPRRALIPGGAPFHSINYWADGNGGYSPYVPEVPINFLKLTLRPPGAGSIFQFAQPVFLEIELENLSADTFNLTPEILDPKSGLLEVLIKRRHSSNPTASFHPVVERCFDFSKDRLADLPPGGTLNNNLNLTFGSAGFPFAEPGEYEVTALLVFFDQQNERDLIVQSNTLPIRIQFPHTPEEDNDAMVLLRKDVGLFFALGGSSVLGKAEKDLWEIKERRQGKAKTITDPIVANIVRCTGINSGRAYERFRDGQFRHLREDMKKAADLLDQLKPETLRNTFDSHTAKHTLSLAKKHRAAIKK